MAKGKLIKKIKVLKNNVQKGVKVGVQKAKEKIKEAGSFAILLPLMPAMITILKIRMGNKYVIGTSPQKTAKLFVDLVVEGKQTYEEYDENFGEEMAIDAVKTIVTKIVEYFKKLKDKKASGQELSEEEQKFVNAGDKMTEAAQTALVEEGKSTAKNIWAQYWYIPVGLIVVLGLYLIFTKK